MNPSAAVTERQLNRTTLGRQGLLQRQPGSCRQVVRQVVGLQAQDPVSPYLALWNRVEGFDPAELDDSFSRRLLVKASLMRITLHVVDRDDFGGYHAAMAASLRTARLNDKRFVPSGLSHDAVDALWPDLAEFLAHSRTEPEIEAWLATRVPGDPEVAWWGMRTFARVARIPTGGPWGFRSIAYEAPELPGMASPESGVEALLLAYLRGFGPATALDFARFTLLRSPVVKQALTALADRLVRVPGPAGEPLWDLAGLPLLAEDTPSPARLLPMWDNLFLGHVNSTRLLPPEFRPLVVRVNGDILPTLLVDGLVAGVWRVVGGRIEATAFQPLSPAQWRDLEGEAERLKTFLESRELGVYTRSHHWWTTGLPGGARFLA